MSSIREFASGVAGLKRRTRFTPYRESFHLARKLDALLDCLSGVELSPEDGVLRILEFFRTDEGVFGTSDDSAGVMGDVYRHRACDMLVEYASKCPDKLFLADAVLDLIREGDNYRIRHIALGVVGRFLSRREMVYLIEHFEGPAEGSDRSGFVCAHTVALQLGDPLILERVHRSQGKNLPVYALEEISRAWFNSNDPETALSWLDRVPDGVAFRSKERQALRTDIYEALGRLDERDALLWAAFRSARSAGRFEALLERVGVENVDERRTLLAAEVGHVLASSRFRLSDLVFLMDTEHIREAARWCYEVRDEIGGHAYLTLPKLASLFSGEGEFLAATILWRALLDDLLGSGRTRAYGHGARYLKQLRACATSIQDWKALSTHDEYEAALMERHGRKSSFWRRLD
ncbi:MAG: hypothetical protein COV99_00405 [Bacteroidetes bacterium CG12_big_fil_rev_8_21_14_0_65_60_17]|nr:MAG: hypothetical protein COV99_00405 [Bacteroidetes bacterium CG12_big_fil_rev_8_21_14_0_65_60_17]